MSLQSYLENLRSKPDHIKSRIAFWTSFGITAVIFVFWLATVTGLSNTATQAISNVVEKAGSPSQSLVASVGAVFVDIKEALFSPKKVNYSTIDIVPGK